MFRSLIRTNDPLDAVSRAHLTRAILKVIQSSAAARWHLISVNLANSMGIRGKLCLSLTSVDSHAMIL